MSTTKSNDEMQNDLSGMISSSNVDDQGALDRNASGEPEVSNIAEAGRSEVLSEPALKLQKLNSGKAVESKSGMSEVNENVQTNTNTPIRGKVKRVVAKRSFQLFLTGKKKMFKSNPDSHAPRAKKVTIVIPSSQETANSSSRDSTKAQNKASKSTSTLNNEERRLSKRKRTKSRKFENEMTIAPIEINDVLLGGPRADKNDGTKRFRRVVQSNLAAFEAASWKNKVAVARRVIDRVKNAKPAGRFFEWKTGNFSYTLAPDAVVLEKVCQMHREMLNHLKSSIARTMCQDEAGCLGGSSAVASRKVAFLNLKEESPINVVEDIPSPTEKSKVLDTPSTDDPPPASNENGTNLVAKEKAEAPNGKATVKTANLSKKTISKESLSTKPEKKERRDSNSKKLPSDSNNAAVPKAITSTDPAVSDSPISVANLPPKLQMFLSGGKPRTAAQSGPKVQVPHDFDVLFGRGNSVSAFPGNTIFRHFCWLHKAAYNAADRIAKRDIALKVIEKIKQLSPPGRFLEFVDGVWVDAYEDKLIEKTCQALRERKWSPATACLEGINLPSSAENIEATGSQVYKTKKEGGKKAPPVRTSNSSLGSSQNENDKTVKYAKPDNKKRENTKAKEPKPTKTVSDLINTIAPGSRISVYWPLDKIYYSGVVEARKHSEVFIEYDDGEGEWLDLSKNKFKVH